MIELVDNPDDLRTKLIILTNQGYKLAKEYRNQLVSAEEKAWTAFSDEEQSQIIELLDKFNKNLDTFKN